MKVAVVVVVIISQFSSFSASSVAFQRPTARGAEEEEAGQLNQTDRQTDTDGRRDSASRVILKKIIKVEGKLARQYQRRPVEPERPIETRHMRVSLVPAQWPPAPPASHLDTPNCLSFPFWCWKLSNCIARRRPRRRRPVR